MLRYIGKCLVFSVFFLVAACETPPPPKPMAIDFSKYPVINVDVARIEVVDGYKSPYKSPNIEHLMPVSPASAMHKWVDERLHATGASNKLLQVTILDAPVTVKELPKTKGVKGIFTIDQDKEYTAKLEVEARLYGEGALSEASTTVSAMASTTIPENANVNARRGAYEELVSQLMNIINEKLEGNLSNYMGNYINSAPPPM